MKKVIRGSEVIKICNLLECLLRLLEDLEIGFDAYDVHKDETLEYEHLSKSLLNPLYLVLLKG